ncbi:MAG TPA: hypothetical protein VMZ53_21795 [Kofleriaceae bacterium]|nr:hypothetical protein [Kofleriaceae bacterium]
MKRLAVLALLFALENAHAEDIDDPRVLFAEGRFAAAAQVFERRWQAKGDATDGVNAVVAWRTAGRYARALTLLSRVRSGKQAPTGAAATTAADLDERLGTLTAMARIEGKLDPNAVIRVDGEPAERFKDMLVLDVGEHDIEIEQPDCDRFLQQVTAYPSGKLVVAFKPRCDVMGTLHVVLATDPGASFTVDGVEHTTTANEADVRLPAGEHQLSLAALERPVYDETVVVREKETTSLRIRYPWRARKLSFILGVTNEVRAGQFMVGTALGLTLGVWTPSFHATFDIGAMVSNAKGLEPYYGAWGHPWLADTLVIHTPRAPVWHGKLGPYRLAFDPQPLGIRFDEIRAFSYAGIRTCEEAEPRVRAWSVLPLALSADGPYAHFELTLWPASVLWYHPAAALCGDDDLPSDIGFGAFVTLTGGWRLF